jgi:WD40 repeat protein
MSLLDRKSIISLAGSILIDLDNPYSPPRHLPHHTPWEVADVQWSPFAARDYWVISTSNQKALVWNLAAIPSHGSSIEFVLHAHTRAITDINFSAHDPDILATCAVDSFVHCWDLRTPRKPVATFCDWFAGATQVKWNRQDSHIIASSHDKCLRIWDNRKGAIPVRSIEAHETKIYGVDWNRTRPSAVVTCSLDKTIKFWDYKNLEDIPERIIRTPFPVWRARHTPFGWGICAMPQRGSNDLYLYDRRVQGSTAEDDTTPPVEKFEGHRDQVKEFLWRPRGNIQDGTDDREFQLVSWSTDHDLRLHRVDEETLEKVGFRKGAPVLRQYNYTRRNATYWTYHEEALPIDGSHIPGESQGKSTDAPSTTEEKAGGPRGMLTVNIHKTSALINGLIDKAYSSSRTGMSGRSTARRDVNLIEWMKGVKIGKSKATGTEARHSNTHDPQAYLPHNFSTATAWDAPESLFDEITHVGDKYKRVTFENLDSQKRLATISMNGPWGDEEKPVHVKIAIQFPEDYPDTSVPTFKMEKTSSIPDEVFEIISGGIQLIAQGYISRKMGCLEPIVCFLLGERGLEDSTAILEDRENALSDSSSDDDDPAGPDLLSLPADDLELGGNELVGRASSNDNVPLPKACGAMFAEDGRLVCFFPPKEDEQKSIMNSLTLMREGDRSNRGLRLFEGFGRIHTASPEAQPLTNSTEEERDDPNESDEYWTDSSDASSDAGVSALVNGLPRLPWGQSFDRRRPRGPLSTDFSQFSAGTGSAVKSNPSKVKSIVSIRSLNDIQPCRQSLAEGYLIRGDPQVISTHNAIVASSTGDQGLASTWELISLLLSNEVPLELAQLESRSVPILVVAEKATKNRRDSGIDLGFDNITREKPLGLRGQIKWGPHPFGQTWLILRIFDYYERLGDVQMLAMLSCVLTESPPKEASNVGHSKSLALDWPRTSPPYSQSQEIGFHLRQATLTVPVTFKAHQTSGSDGSDLSTGKMWHHEINRSLSTSITPPRNQQRHRVSPGQLESQAGSLSFSPEQQHHHRRSSAALLSESPSNVSRSLPSNSMASVTPAALRKRPSPVEAVLGNLAASGVTWGANTIFGSSQSGKRSSTDVATFSDSDSAASDTPEKHPNSRTKNFGFKKKNQQMFDQESHLGTPLLDPMKADIYQGYRAAYANLLDVWGLHIPRVELLKYNGITPSVQQLFYYPDSTGNLPEDTGINLGRKHRDTSITSTGEDQMPGLKVRRTCHRCGTPTSQCPSYLGSGKKSSCPNCGVTLNRLTCDICWSPVLGLYTACLDCGQVAHQECLEVMQQGQKRSRTASDHSTSTCACLTGDAEKKMEESERNEKRTESSQKKGTWRHVLGGLSRR